jgi:hypothetical protein
MPQRTTLPRALRNRVAQLYTQAICSLFVVSYDSQGYGGGIRIRLHAGIMIQLRVRITLQLAVYLKSVCLGAKPLQIHDQQFFQLNPCGYSPYVTSSLTRGWVCRCQTLLALASVVILGSESCGTNHYILLYQI